MRVCWYVIQQLGNSERVVGAGMLMQLQLLLGMEI